MFDGISLALPVELGLSGLVLDRDRV